MSEVRAASSSGWRRMLRFLASGGINTLATWVLYALLLQVLPYRWSYTIAYLLGIALAYLLYRYYVFGTRGGRFGPLWVALIYLVQYVLGLVLVSFWVQVLRQPVVWAPIFAVLVSLPLTYMLNRFVFRPRADAARRTPKSLTS